MQKPFGKIRLSGDETIIWNFEGKEIEESVLSNPLLVPTISKVFFFGFDETTNTPTLHLCNFRVINEHKNVRVISYLNIILKYEKETKEMTVKPTLLEDDLLTFIDIYRIAEINVKNLCEIIFKLQISTGTLTEKGSNDNELEDKENVETEENEVKTRGEAALISSLKNYFLNEELSDVAIKVGDQNYPAHQVIVRSRSSVFDKMLKHDMSEKKKGIIDIPDSDPYIFRDFLLYIYAGKIDNISNENVFELFHMSDKYDVKELRMECVDFLMNNLTTEVICDVIFLATRCHEPALLKLATKFFVDNAKEIVLTVQWLKFLKENPIEANELFVKYMNKDSAQ